MDNQQTLNELIVETRQLVRNKKDARSKIKEAKTNWQNQAKQYKEQNAKIKTNKARIKELKKYFHQQPIPTAQNNTNIPAK